MTDGIFTFDSDITLLAKWTPIRYTISYNLDGGTVEGENPTSYTIEDGTITLKNPTKEGYTFAGWSGTGLRDATFTVKIDAGSIGNREYVAVYYFDTTDLIFCVTNDSNRGELAARSEKYLAGREDNGDIIPESVKRRNDEAAKFAGVKMSYIYFPDNFGYSWSQVGTHILTLIHSGESGAPDIYENFIYDMVAVSLQGGFSNLLTTRQENNFAFAKNPLYATEVGDAEGYMYDYMQSLVLSPKKMYLLASDYFIDAVRSFFVLPVNLQLFDTLPHEELTGDLNGDDMYTVDDFYQLIKNKDWTYDALIKYSSAIYTAGVDWTGSTSMRDDCLGFAVSSNSGLSSSALLYSSSVTIIDRTWSAEGTQSYDAYRIPNDGFVALCDKLSELFTSTGVLAVSNSQAAEAGYMGDAVAAIRFKFTENRMLFGGIVCLGNLEEEAYRQMKADGGMGFGIAPVPLDKQDETHSRNYNTQMHSIGHVGAISITTPNFAKCSSFLDYQSRHSTSILEEYYKETLTYGEETEDALACNVEMAHLLRANVGSSFDKAYNDAIDYFYRNVDETISNSKFHIMLQQAGFCLEDAETKYQSIAEIRQSFLDQLKLSVFDALPE